MQPLENSTVGALLHRTAERFPMEPAVYSHETAWNYAALEEKTEAMAARLLGMGLRKGDHAALWGELDPEMLLVFYAVQMVGAVAVMPNTSLGKQELLPLLEKTGTRFLIVGRSYKASHCLAEIAQKMALPGCVREMLTMSGAGIPGCRAVSALPMASAEVLQSAQQAVQPEDTAVILFTSGSTGCPKAVMSSHFSRVNGGIQQADDLHATHLDRFCVTMPVFHCFCISVNLMASLAVGGCLCIPSDRHTSTITAMVEQRGCTVLSSVPTMYHALIGKKEFIPQRFATLRTGIIGGAYYPPEEFARIEQAFGPHFRLMSSLGQTETTAGMTICNLDDSLEVRSRTVGHFMNYVEGKIVDIHTGETLPAGYRGEICVRGYLTMQGYYADAEQTAKVLDAEGWVHTGDLGILDEAGNVTLRGRIKELIIRGGENISPCEIETVLLMLPQIAQCKVVGVPDSHYGEEICACIQFAAGESLAECDIKQHILSQLADYKMPKYFLYWEQLPVTSSGKVSSALCAKDARTCLGL